MQPHRLGLLHTMTVPAGLCCRGTNTMYERSRRARSPFAQDLGVTSLDLLPEQHFATDRIEQVVTARWMYSLRRQSAHEDRPAQQQQVSDHFRHTRPLHLAPLHQCLQLLSVLGRHLAQSNSELYLSRCLYLYRLRRISQLPSILRRPREPSLMLALSYHIHQGVMRYRHFLFQHRMRNSAREHEREMCSTGVQLLIGLRVHSIRCLTYARQ